MINKKITNKSKEETNKEWREKNKEILERKRDEYNEKNRDRNVERCNNYYYKNQKKLLEQKSEKVICECGFIGIRGNLAQHRKTQKHLRLMEQLNRAVECETPKTVPDKNDFITANLVSSV